MGHATALPSGKRCYMPPMVPTYTYISNCKRCFEAVQNQNGCFNTISILKSDQVSFTALIAIMLYEAYKGTAVHNEAYGKKTKRNDAN